MYELNHSGFVSNIVLAHSLRCMIYNKYNLFTENERRVLEILAEMLDGFSKIPNIKIANDDLISRQSAIDCVFKRIEELRVSSEYRRKHVDIDVQGIARLIAELPAVQPKEKTGHWTIIGKVLIPLFRGGYEHEFKYKCSECGFEHALPIPKNFCPNCGAKMFKGNQKEGNDNESD